MIWREWGGGVNQHSFSEVLWTKGEFFHILRIRIKQYTQLMFTNINITWLDHEEKPLLIINEEILLFIKNRKKSLS